MGTSTAHANWQMATTNKRWRCDGAGIRARNMRLLIPRVCKMELHGRSESNKTGQTVIGRNLCGYCEESHYGLACYCAHSTRTSSAVIGEWTASSEMKPKLVSLTDLELELASSRFSAFTKCQRSQSLLRGAKSNS